MRPTTLPSASTSKSLCDRWQDELQKLPGLITSPSFDLAQDLEPPALERVEVVARSLLRHGTIEGRDVAAAVAVEPLHEPVAASLAVWVHAHLALEQVAHRRACRKRPAYSPRDPARWRAHFGTWKGAGPPHRSTKNLARRR